MITLIQTMDPGRFDIALEEGNRLEDEAEPEGYIIQIENKWRPFDNNHNMVGHDQENPVEAGKLVIRNYRERAAAILTKNIERMLRNMDEMPEGQLRKVRERMINSLQAKLDAGDY